jgi:cytochrome b6
MGTLLYPEPKTKPGLYDWLDERLGISDVIALAKHKTVPQHRHSFWYYWGGLSLFFFIIQLFTGILLLVYFRPGKDAYDSVRQITYDIDFGWLIRSVHSWSANLMVFAVCVHMFSAFFMKAYRKPREFAWWSGLVLLLLTLVFGFSGYLLPMDELSFVATKIGLQFSNMIPVVGPVLADLIRGGPQVSPDTVQRFFALHVVVLPLLFLPLLMFHLFLVQKHGNASPPGEESRPASEKQTMPFFPNFFAMDLGMWLIALNVITILATLFPWDLGPQADPLASAPNGIHPEWYFMPPFHLLKIIGRFVPGVTGELLGMGLFAAVLIFWTLVPLFDPKGKAGRAGRFVTWGGVLVLSGMILLIALGYADLGYTHL